MSTKNNIDNDAFRHFFDVEQPWLPDEQMPSIDLDGNSSQSFWDAFITGDAHSASAVDNASFDEIKQEDTSDTEILISSSIRTRLVDEDGHEAIEILDSDDDTSQFDFDLVPSANNSSPLSPLNAISTNIPLDGFDDASTAVDSEFDGEVWSDDEMGIEDITEMEVVEPVGEACKVDSVVDGTEEPTWKLSNTTWLDPDVTSEVLEARTKINRVLTVDRLERVHGIPSYWPIPRTKTAYLLDLNDEKYYTPGKVLSPDGLIKNKCQDSLHGGTGQNDSKAKVFVFGEEPVECRRSRLSCGGVYVCEKLDPTLLATERYELDVSSLEAVVQAQVQSRVQENDSIEKNAILFWHVIHARPCRAVDSNDAPCTGRPIMKKFTEMRSGPHQHFIACSDWSPTFRKGHASFTIPANVDGPSLAKLFESGRLEGISDVPTCSRIISARIGRKAGNCKYPHNADGHASTIKHHKCSASMTIFIPCDSTCRLACVIIGEKPHNHPVLPASKVSAEVEEMYRKCITAVGVAGATVTSIEKAPSTSVLLNGKSPALFHPALNSRALQRKFLLREKQKIFPHGNGIEGVRVLFKEDAKLSADCRYIHIWKGLFTLC